MSYRILTLSYVHCASASRILPHISEFSGASTVKPIALVAHGSVAIHASLAIMVKTFSLSNHEIFAMLIDGESSAVHWRADTHSRITGASVCTELIDLIEIRNDHIVPWRSIET